MRKPVKSSPGLEKREEKLGKDLDGDKEKGESPAHRAKVLGKGASKGMPPAFLKEKSAKGCCPACKKKGMTSCSHV